MMDCIDKVLVLRVHKDSCCCSSHDNSWLLSSSVAKIITDLQDGEVLVGGRSKLGERQAIVLELHPADGEGQSDRLAAAGKVEVVQGDGRHTAVLLYCKGWVAKDGEGARVHRASWRLGTTATILLLCCAVL